MHKRGVYSPQLSRASAFLLRRIAWAAGKPMTRTLDGLLAALLPWINQKAMCEACQDKRCPECLLHNHSGEQPEELSSVIRKTRRQPASKTASTKTR